MIGYLMTLSYKEKMEEIFFIVYIKREHIKQF